jgi:hypothetical protein
MNKGIFSLKGNKMILQETKKQKKPTCMAYYLGQYHPIEENDNFWGKGFSEWHNVAKARPLYLGHKQPSLPGDFGFYDLRSEEVIQSQINYAVSHGIDGFCYWHYWFAGKRLLTKPLDKICKVNNNKIKIMLGWANESWSGIWHGEDKRILIEQRYDNDEQKEHAKVLSDYFNRDDYFAYNGKPVFLIYKPKQLPNLGYLNRLREHIFKNIKKDIYVIGNWGPGLSQCFKNPEELGLDSAVITPLGDLYKNRYIHTIYNVYKKIIRDMKIGPEIKDFNSINKLLVSANKILKGVTHQTVITGWDNTPRSGRRGLVLKNYNNVSFENHVRIVLGKEIERKSNILFIKSFNEWAEGNTFEPKFNANWNEGSVFSRIINETFQ